VETSQLWVLPKPRNHKNYSQPSFVGMWSRMEKPSAHSLIRPRCAWPWRARGGICRSLAISSLLPQCTFVFVGFPLMAVWSSTSSQKRGFVLFSDCICGCAEHIFENLFELFLMESVSGRVRASTIYWFLNSLSRKGGLLTKIFSTPTLLGLFKESGWSRKPPVFL